MDIESLKAAVAAAQNPAPVKVPGVHLLGDVFVRVNTAKQGSEWRDISREFAEEDKASGTHTGRLLASMLCDESGALVFNPRSAEQVLQLAGLPDSTVAQILTAASVANYPKLEATPQGNG